jgi:FlaG/FlaF family flagellin (archaellin)
MAKSNTTTVEKKVVEHSPCTIAVGKVRLAAIAAIAEPAYRVALAYVQQAQDELANAEAVMADDAKDIRQVNTARRWVAAAEVAANDTTNR